MSHAEYLAGLAAAELTALLEHRPDVLVEPVPRSHDELALRLGGVDSLSRALPGMNRDEVVVVRTLAMLGPAPRPCCNRDGNLSVRRDIAPRQRNDRWLDAWCHLRSAERSSWSRGSRRSGWCSELASAVGRRGEGGTRGVRRDRSG